MSRQDIEGYDSETAYLAHRQEYIGGADAAPILGLSPFPDATRKETWRKKICDPAEIDQINNRYMKRGNRMEPIVQEMVQDRIDSTAEPGEHIRHDEFEFIGGTPDMDAIGRIYEIKCPGTDRVADIRKNGVPEYYWIQCEHYRLLKGKPVTLMVLDYNEWRLYQVDIPEPDDGLHERMIEEYRRFWEHVRTETPPEEDDLKNLSIEVATGGPKLNNLLEGYYKAHEESKELDKKRKRIKGRIVTRAKGLDAVETEDYRATISRRSNGDSEWTVLNVSPLRSS
jgi:putative phage-type endonuclease